MLSATDYGIYDSPNVYRSVDSTGITMHHAVITGADGTRARIYLEPSRVHGGIRISHNSTGSEPAMHGLSRNRFVGAYALGAILMIASPGTSAAGTPDRAQAPPAGAEGAAKSAMETAAPWAPGMRDETLTHLQSSLDVTSYLLDLVFDPTNKSVSGTVTITAASLASSLQTLVLDLAGNIALVVKRGNVPLPFSHAGTFS